MFRHSYNDIIRFENFLKIWEYFLRGKRRRKDVMFFQLKLGENLSELQRDLETKTYVHGPYTAFDISDPKPRNIHKALVRDRVLHHLIHKEIYPYFDRRFIYDSYSCRKNKGVHCALDRFKYFAGKVSKNHTKQCYVLKCDIRKFFASIDHDIIKKILAWHIEDRNIRWLCGQIISSFEATPGRGLPLGNLTSQLFANVYMHEFDIFIKQKLKIKYYIRYADDFVILSDDRKYLEEVLPKINNFLETNLKLKLHPEKVYIKTYSSGIDFLGWIHFPHHLLIRTRTKRKIIKILKRYPRPETINSYRGLLGHGNTYKIRKQIGLENEAL